MGMGIARANIDWATTHVQSDVHTEPGDTMYMPGANMTVFVNGQPAVVQMDSVMCGELAIGCSTTVFIGGKGVHRLQDLCDSHAFTYSPSVCAVASTNVIAG